MDGRGCAVTENSLRHQEVRAELCQRTVTDLIRKGLRKLWVQIEDDELLTVNVFVCHCDSTRHASGVSPPQQKKKKN